MASPGLCFLVVLKESWTSSAGKPNCNLKLNWQQISSHCALKDRNLSPWPHVPQQDSLFLKHQNSPAASCSAMFYWQIPSSNQQSNIHESTQFHFSLLRPKLRRASAPICCLDGLVPTAGKHEFSSMCIWTFHSLRHRQTNRCKLAHHVTFSGTFMLTSTPDSHFCKSPSWQLPQKDSFALCSQWSCKHGHCSSRLNV